ncbi:glycosyltransferase [Streptosporangium lutulentum]
MESAALGQRDHPRVRRSAPLDLALAALAAQTYPDHLMEVIVVDDGSTPPLRLPEIAPSGTRIEVADPSGWGTANAVNTGAALSEGRIIQRLDSDMVVCREHIEALARWHHLADYLVTIGAKKFIEEPDLSAARVYDGVRTSPLESVFDLSGALPSSTERTIQRTNGLRASRNPYHVCTGPTVSMLRETFQAVGGVDPSVLRGEDTEFAYRLAQRGVVFIPDPTAQAVHLGLPAQRLDKERTVRSVAPTSPSAFRSAVTCARTGAAVAGAVRGGGAPRRRALRPGAQGGERGS